MNTANKLTIARMFMLLPVLGLMIFVITQGKVSYSTFDKTTLCFILAGAIFILAMATDALDGYVARKYNQITTFGKLFDPLADKLMTTTTFILLSVQGIVPIYITLIFILRDIIVDGSRNVAAKHNINVAANWWGKAKTLTQTIGIVVIFFVLPALQYKPDFFVPSWQIWIILIPTIIASVLSIISGINYFKAITGVLFSEKVKK